MQSIRCGEGIWGPPGVGNGNGLDGGGWPTPTPGGVVKESPPKTCFGLECKLGNVKPIPLGKCQLSPEGSENSRSGSGLPGSLQLNRYEEKENSSPEFGAIWMKVKKVPLGTGQVLGRSSIMNFGSDLGLKGAAHVPSFEVKVQPMGGPVMYYAPHCGRAPLFNEPKQFSSLAGESSNGGRRSCPPSMNPDDDAWRNGFITGRQYMAMSPPVLYIPPPIIPGGNDQLLDSGYSSWNASCATTPEAGEAVPSRAGDDKPKQRVSRFNINKADMTDFIKTYGYGQGEQRQLVNRSPNRKYFRTFNS